MENQHRTLTGHQVNPANDTLTISVVDQPGSGGAHHAYLIKGASMLSNPSMRALQDLAKGLRQPDAEESYFVLFQNGPIAEVGVNGVTHEVLLEIIIDRLKCFQNGPFANSFNGQALGFLQAAQDLLTARTRERMSRGVEGMHQK